METRSKQSVTSTGTIRPSDETAASDSSCAMTVYHATTPTAAEQILSDGFRDSQGSYMLVGVVLKGVWVSDGLLGLMEGAKGSFTLAMVIPREEFEQFELIEEGKPYRESCMPASLLNASGAPYIYSHDWDEHSREEMLHILAKWESMTENHFQQAASEIREHIEVLDKHDAWNLDVPDPDARFR